jgi:fermentation-respiration switch protein FrsA (DUF1100 family)
MFSSFVWLLVVVLAAYLGTVAVVFLFQRALIYHPAIDIETPAAMGVPEMAAVRLRTEDGLDLVAWYAPPRRDDGPVLAYFHGNAGTIAQRAFKARLYIDAGYGLLLIEYRGYGGNPGRPSETGLYADARAGLGWLAAKDIPAERIILYGESLGSGVAVQMAVETPGAAAVVLEAPFTSIPDVGAGIYPLMPVHLLTRDRFENLTKIARIGSPLLVIHGRRDRVVPFRLGERLYQAAPQPKGAVFLPQADHVDLYEWGAGASIVEFLDGLKTRQAHPVSD